MPSIFNKFEQAQYFSATLLIKGTVTKQGVPISCPVRAYSRNTGVLLSSTVSKPDGSYVLFGTRAGSNQVLAIDPAEEFNITAQDNVK
jgi:hypothetical protein